jgi:hypothetical protein
MKACVLHIRVRKKLAFSPNLSSSFEMKSVLACLSWTCYGTSDTPPTAYGTISIPAAYYTISLFSLLFTVQSSLYSSPQEQDYPCLRRLLSIMFHGSSVRQKSSSKGRSGLRFPCLPPSRCPCTRGVDTDRTTTVSRLAS